MTRLDLEYNAIGSKGALALANNLPHLETLNISKELEM